MGSGLLRASYCIYEEDFIDTSVIDSVHPDLSAPWRWTAFGDGADIPNVSSFKDEAFGVLRISTGTADNSYVTGQLAAEWILPATGKRILFKTRFNCSDATQSDILIGVLDTASTNFVNALQDGIYFRKDDGDAKVDFVIEAAGSATAVTAIHTLEDDVDVELAFEWLSTGSGTGIAVVFVDGLPVARIKGLRYYTGAPANLMSLGVGIRAGEGARKHLDLDYIGAVVQR